MEKILFIDRDGTLAIEPSTDAQIDSLEKLEFFPGVFRWLGKIAIELDYTLVMVSNQDGLGTPSFPEDTFWPSQNKIIQAFKNEEIEFSNILIDKSLPEENKNTRKPNTGLLTQYIYGNYDLSNSFVIGDRSTDVELAQNLNCKSIYLNSSIHPSADLSTESWKEIYQYLAQQERKAKVNRNTTETNIIVEINLDGEGKSNIHSGIRFLDHMLDQVARHACIDLHILCNGDLDIDEHHSIEDIAICLGEAFKTALGSKKAIERYGFLLPMDDCLAQVAIDFGGRPWLDWDVVFKREKIGDMPTEMIMHFFKSFSDASQCNLNIKAEGFNEHHKIESIFKAFAKSIKMAIQKTNDYSIPSTKGTI